MKATSYIPIHKRGKLRVTPRSLLVIDDNDDFITLVKFFLEQDTDWKIITALDGKEGIAETGLPIVKIVPNRCSTRSLTLD